MGAGAAVRKGEPVARYVDDAALERLAEAVGRAVREGDLDEDALAELFALRR